MRIPGILLAVVFVLSFLCDFYIWKDIQRHTRNNRIWGRVYAVTSILCWIFLIVTVCLPRRSGDSEIICVMWMLYSYLTVYLSKIVYVICSLIGKIPMLWKKSSFNGGLWIGLPLASLCFITMWWGALVTRSEVNVNRIKIEEDGLPQSYNGYKIAQFSDAHLGTWGNDTTFVCILVDSINSLHPDLIVFTGDIVNRSTRELEPFLKVLRRLHAPDGVYSVLGNHDYGDYIDWKYPSEKAANRELLLAWQRQMGWKMLNNEHTFLTRNSDSIVLIGVENWGEPPFKQYGRLEKAYPSSGNFNLTDSRYKILFSHNPEHWRREVSKNTNINLTLSGHTHAMQFMLQLGNWRWSPSKYKYEEWGGLYEKVGSTGSPTRIYVNIGCGEVGLPCRIGALPEITLIELVSTRVTDK